MLYQLSYEGEISKNGWCPEEESNLHVLSDTATSTLRVYQFRHRGGALECGCQHWGRTSDLRLIKTLLYR